MSDADIFDPVTKLWTPAASMNYPRWLIRPLPFLDASCLSLGRISAKTCVSSSRNTDTWTAIPIGRSLIIHICSYCQMVVCLNKVPPRHPNSVLECHTLTSHQAWIQLREMEHAAVMS